MKHEAVPPLRDQVIEIDHVAEKNWNLVVDCLLIAADELIPNLNDGEIQLLEEDFTSKSGTVLKAYEKFSPGITDAVFDRAYEIQKERQEIEMLPVKFKLTRKIFRGIFLPPL